MRCNRCKADSNLFGQQFLESNFFANCIEWAILQIEISMGKTNYPNPIYISFFSKITANKILYYFMGSFVLFWMYYFSPNYQICCIMRSRCYVRQFFLRQFFWFSSTIQEWVVFSPSFRTCHWSKSELIEVKCCPV